MSLVSSVESTKGFHFTCNTKIYAPNLSQCDTLLLRYTLPPTVFVDPYELNIQYPAYSGSMTAISDLELPVLAMSGEQQYLNLTISLPAQSATHDSPLVVTLPFHARYGQPSNYLGGAHQTVDVPQPTGFLACQSPGMLGVLLCSLNLRSSDGQYRISLDHSASSLKAIVLHVPVGLTADLDQVEMGTVAVVTTMFLYLSYIFTRTARRLKTRSRNKME